MLMRVQRRERGIKREAVWHGEHLQYVRYSGIEGLCWEI
jgi:hypothetical protein